MIDIHSHILPSLDDGARSLEEAVEMARTAAGDGITHMVATPHAFNGLSHNPTTDEILRRVDAFQQALGTLIGILPGNEVHFSHDTVEMAQACRVTPLNRQNYMLIEFPSIHIPMGAGVLFGKLRNAGIVPILAHPERNLEIQRRPSLVAAFVESGVRIQVTAMSVTGRFGPAAFACVRKLLEHHCVHFIATDAHRARGRPPVLSEARDAAGRIIGPAAARKLVEDNPRAVVEGKALDLPHPVSFPEAARGGSVLSRMFRNLN